MQFLSIEDDNAVRIAAEALSAGLLVAFPTETVYGLGADVFNPKALAAVFAAKGRPRFDPLIVHIADPAALERIARLSLLERASRERAAALMARFWPGPLTLILPRGGEVPDLATSGLPTVAVRFPAHPGAQRLIRLSTGAIAAPSANPFGRLSPTRAEHVREGLGDRVDIILDGGPAEVGVESTVLDLCTDPPRILRPGGISRERIEEIAGSLAAESCGAGSLLSVPAASPGMLKSHYAPRTLLSVHSREEMLALDYRPGEGILFFDGTSRDAWFATQKMPVPPPVPPAVSSVRGMPLSPGAAPQAKPETIPVYRVFSEGGDLSEAAAKLFELLHDFDGLGLSRIRAELAPDTGLGAAINDRLRRAQGV
ncbi:MAG: threonylcarbamoyl-AMP synthase [Spirochaetaceae bacterium]|nr:threonylcarbamoyl-AMP synthase [Spirochaetaceae bacterium]